jgi:hypothetical protein
LVLPHPNPSPGGRGAKNIIDKILHPFSPGRRGRGMRPKEKETRTGDEVKRIRTRGRGMRPKEKETRMGDEVKKDEYVSVILIRSCGEYV